MMRRYKTREDTQYVYNATIHFTYTIVLPFLSSPSNPQMEKKQETQGMRRFSGFMSGRPALSQPPRCCMSIGGPAYLPTSYSQRGVDFSQAPKKFHLTTQYHAALRPDISQLVQSLLFID